MDIPCDRIRLGGVEPTEHHMQAVTKAEFREIYFRLGGGERTGWGLQQWNRQFEHEARPGMRYLVEEPPTPAHNRMMIVTDFGAGEHRLFFMTEEAEEGFFDHPGREPEA